MRDLVKCARQTTMSLTSLMSVYGWHPHRSSCAHVAEHTPYVSLNHAALDSAAEEISEFLKDTSFDLGSWVLEPLHPDPKTCPFNFFDWIFFVSALNFSFWSESDQEHRFGIEWKRGLDGKGGSGTIIHSGYASLLAGIGRGAFNQLSFRRLSACSMAECLETTPMHAALEEGVPITTPSYYANMTQAQLQHVFRSARQETMPLLEQRLDVLHQVGRALLQRWQGSFENVVRAAGGSAVALVQLMVQEFPPFDDASQYQGQTGPSLRSKNRREWVQWLTLAPLAQSTCTRELRSVWLKHGRLPLLLSA